VQLGDGKLILMSDSTGTTGDRSVIRLHRQQGFCRDHFGKYRIRLDGSPVDKIAEGQTKDFSVPPGEHRLRLTSSRLWSSREVTFIVREGERAEFTCRPGGSAVQSVFALLVPNRYIRLNGPIVAS